MFSPYPNVVLHDDITKHPDHPTSNYTMHPMMAALLDVLAVKYSSWVFKCNAIKTTGAEVEGRTPVTIMGFLVMDKGDVVGTVGLDTRYHATRGSERCYKVYNQRLSRARERGSSTLTTNVKHAIKTIETFFTPPPIREQLGAIYYAGRENLDSSYRVASMRVRDYAEDLNPHIQEYININKDQFLQWLSPDNAKLAIAAFEAKGKAQEMEALREKGKDMLTVLIEGDKYTVLHNGNMCVFAQDDLLPEMRQRIGMLKLVEPGSVLPDVGTRVNANAFLIVAPDNFSSEVQP